MQANETRRQQTRWIRPLQPRPQPHTATSTKPVISCKKPSSCWAFLITPNQTTGLLPLKTDKSYLRASRIMSFARNYNHYQIKSPRQDSRLCAQHALPDINHPNRNQITGSCMLTILHRPYPRNSSGKISCQHLTVIFKIDGIEMIQYIGTTAARLCHACLFGCS